MLTKIEQALLSCNSDKFANICRLYLSYKFHIVNSTGFVLGKEKSKKGTPDNFIPCKDYFIFNEVTTQEKKLVEKLKKDISHCFNQNVVPKEKIISIILICNSKIDLDIQHTLNKYKNLFSDETELEVIGLDAFSNIIYRDYPSILKELGISIDTGQILEFSEFVSQYDNTRFATPLSNKFYNREEEIKLGLKKLEDNDILLITGDAGVGKTKISLELTKNFIKENENYYVKYIISNGNLCIWDDLKTQLLVNRNYLIIVDDANKLKSNLKLIYDFIITRVNKGKIKLILTVRNYVKDEVKNIIDKFSVLDIKKFDKKELSVILRSKEFNISNYYIDRIFSISKGNPRIAIMAAMAGLNKDIEKLNNASEIYKEYFSSVHKSIDDLNDTELLTVTGIISLYRTIDLNDDNLTKEIELYFNINCSVLLEKCKLLNKHEILDEHGSIYKISEQILGEYIFYSIFIKDKKISFKLLLDIYYSKTSFPLWKILTPIISNYGFEDVRELIYLDIIRKWNEIKDEDLNKSLLFLKDFWFYIQNDSLVFVNNIVNQNQTNDDYSKYDFTLFNDNSIEYYDDRIIDVLVKFKQVPDKLEFALEILLKYGIKNQINFSKLLKAYKQSFVYNQYSLPTDYITENIFFEFLYNKVKDDELFYSKIILFIAPKFLVNMYMTNSSDGQSMYIQHIPIILTDIHKEFRSKVWRFVFNCYENNELKNDVKKLISSYSLGHDYHNKVDKVIEFDKKLILAFFKKSFTMEEYSDCYIVNNYLDRLEIFNIKYIKTFRQKFTSKLYTTYLTFNEDRLKRKEFKGDYEKYDDYKLEELKNFTLNFNLKDYETLISDLNYIHNYELNSKGYNRIERSIVQMLENLYELNKENLFQVLDLIMKNEYFSNELQLGHLFLKVQGDVEVVKELRCFLKSNVGTIKFLPVFWSFLKVENFIDEDLELFYNYLERDNSNFSFIDSFFINNSIIINKPNEINKTFDVIFKRRSKLLGGYYLKSFFIYVYENFEDVFESRLNDIEAIYLVLDSQDRMFDYRLDLLKYILIKDTNFVKKLLVSNFDTNSYISKRDLLENDFSKLWELDKHEEIFFIIFNFFNKIPRYWSNSESDFSTFFKGNSQTEIEFINSLIDRTSKKSELANIYNLVVTKYNNLRLEFLKTIIFKNSSIELFEKLDFYVQSTTYSGSRKPRIKTAISELEYVKDFIQNFKDVKFLEHISFLENKIMMKKAEIENEIKREFIDELGI